MKSISSNSISYGHRVYCCCVDRNTVLLSFSSVLQCMQTEWNQNSREASDQGCAIDVIFDHLTLCGRISRHTGIHAPNEGVQ